MGDVALILEPAGLGDGELVFIPGQRGPIMDLEPTLRHDLRKLVERVPLGLFELALQLPSKASKSKHLVCMVPSLSMFGSRKL